MVNSGSINGVPVHSNYEFLQIAEREDLGWDGMLITDWADINNLYTRERIAANKKEAIQIAINAGIDAAAGSLRPQTSVHLKEDWLKIKVPMGHGR